MKLTSISLNNFRNFRQEIFLFKENITLLVGDNSRGKTNILESIYFLCMGKGFKNEKQEDLISFTEDTCSVTGEFSNRLDKNQFRIFIKKESFIKKSYFINMSKKILAQYLKFTPAAILFSPELMSVISGEPSERRYYIDSILEKIDVEYKKRLRNYQNGMRRRNKILVQEENRVKLKELLVFWNDYLIQQAEYIQKKRQWLCEELNLHPEISSHEFLIEYSKNEISEKRFEEYSDKEYYQKRTLIGPQRDDYIFFKKSANGKEINVHKFCSRGEQRLCLFWLIIGHMNIIFQQTGNKPIVLLDDIFSELDEDNKKIILGAVKDYQTIISTTEEEFANQFKQNAQIIRVKKVTH